MFYIMYLIKLNYFIPVLLVIEDAETLIANLKHEELTCLILR